MCCIMIFSSYVMFIYDMFTFKRKAYRGFCLLQNCQHGHCLSAQDKIRSGQIQSVFVRDRSFFMREGGLVGFGKHHLKIA